MVKSGFLAFKGLGNSFRHAVTENFGPKSRAAEFCQKLYWDGFNSLSLSLEQ